MPDTNPYGTAGEPAVSGAASSTSTTQTNESTRGDKARVGTDAFLQANGLDPKNWHLATNLPVQAKDPKDPNLTIPNTYTVTAIGPLGEVRTITLVPQGGSVPQGTPLDQVDWNVTGIDQTVKPSTTSPAETNAQIAEAQARTAQATAAADASKAQLAQIQQQDAERQANFTKSGYYLTDKELLDQKNALAQQGLDQSRIDAQLKIASDSNQATANSNLVAAQNAATNAFVAQKNAEDAEARVKLGQGQLDLQAAQDLWTQHHAEIVDAQNDRKQALDELAQRQANQIAQGQLAATNQANVLRGQEISQQAQNQALSAGAQAASTVYSADLQRQQAAAQTGQSLLANRAKTFQDLAQAPFTQAAQLSQGSAGRYGMLGGGLQGGLGPDAISNIILGAYGVANSMYGGQGTIDAAMQAVQQIAPNAAQTPQGKAAAGVLAQMMDMTNRVLGRGNVAAPTTANPAAAAAAAAGGQTGVASPPPATVLAPVQTPAMASGQVAPPNQVPGQNYGYAGAPPWAGAVPQPLAAPTTVAAPSPTVVVNA